MIAIKNPRLRNWLRWLIPLVLIPAMVALGALVFPQKQHLLVSLGVAALSLVLFLCGFERRLTGSRRLVLAAVLIALCVAGRLIPVVKPVTAIIILTGMYLGGETGFLVGSMAAVLSNFYFGQGPWTAFQMLAWGLIGLAAGWLHQPLKQSRLCLLAYGILSGAVYSLVMDVW
ncbi:MAG: ECF transporter S component, partial [Clostridia bacterium]|nr:ECF transporter S component [Clostridia bacterium]